MTTKTRTRVTITLGTPTARDYAAALETLEALAQAELDTDGDSRHLQGAPLASVTFSRTVARHLRQMLLEEIGVRSH